MWSGGRCHGIGGSAPVERRGREGETVTPCSRDSVRVSFQPTRTHKILNSELRILKKKHQTSAQAFDWESWMARMVRHLMLTSPSRPCRLDKRRWVMAPAWSSYRPIFVKYLPFCIAFMPPTKEMKRNKPNINTIGPIKSLILRKPDEL